MRIGEVRSLLPARVNVMALTATATVKLRMDVSRIIGMRNELVVFRSPCKANIMYAVIEFSTIEETFLPMAERLQKQGSGCPRAIIYCRTYSDCIYSLNATLAPVSLIHPMLLICQDSGW